MRTGVFLQARLSSTRLPRKALLKLRGKTVLEHCMESLSSIPGSAHVLLTDADSAGWFRPLAERVGFDVFIGDPSNVLERYLNAAEHFNIDCILRATGDNPLVSSDLAIRTLELNQKTNSHYTGFYGSPLGTGVEVLITTSLMESRRDPSLTDYEKEHVGPYLYHRSEEFYILRNMAPKPFYLPHERVTLDTKEDFDKIQNIYQNLYQGAPISLDRLCTYLVREESA